MGWQKHTNKAARIMGNVRTQKDESKVSSFLPITKQRFMENILDIKLSFLLALVTWEFSAYWLNNVLQTIAMTAEVWRD